MEIDNPCGNSERIEQMKSLQKKAISLLLVMAMLTMLLPVTAMAAETSTAADAAALVDAVASAGEGDTIQLTDNITLDATLAIPADKTIVLDLNGFTLTVSKDVNVIDNSGDLTVKNGTVAGLDKGAGTQGMAVNNLEGANLVVTQDENAETKLIGRSGLQNYGNATVHAGEITSYNRNAVYTGEGSTTLITGGNIIASMGSSGMGRAVSAVGDLTITGGYFYAGGTSTAGDAFVNAISIFNGATLTIDPAEGSTVQVISETDYAVSSSNGIVRIYGGEFACNGVRTDILEFSDGDIQIQGGSFRHEPYDEYLAEGYIAAPEGDGYVIEKTEATVDVTVTSYEELEAALNGEISKPQNITLAADMEIPADADFTLQRGYSLTIPAEVTLCVNGILRLNGTLQNEGTLEVTAQGFLEHPLNLVNEGTIAGYPTEEDGVCLISTPMELQWLSYMVEQDEIPTLVKLTRDIVMPDVEFTPIGNTNFYYNSTFDGCGYTISNIQVVVTTEYRGGLFGNIADATVKNLTISGTSTNSTSSYIGALAGYMSGSCTVQNVHIQDYTVYSPISYGVGGFVGQIWTKDANARYEFIGCSLDAEVTGFANQGGIWGTSTGSLGTIGIYNCTLSGEVTTLAVNGGICGGYGASAPVEIIGLDCTNLTATVNGKATDKLVAYTETTVETTYADAAVYDAVKDAEGNWTYADAGTIAATVDGMPYSSLEDALAQVQDDSLVHVEKAVSLTGTVSIDCDVKVTGFANVTVAAGGSLRLSAGTYDANPAAYVADGYVGKVNADGTYTIVPMTAENAVASITDEAGETTYYNSLTAAIQAAQAGQTVLLEQNVVWPGTDTTVLAVDNLTLDLNGYTLCAANFALVFEGDNFTIRNGVLGDGTANYALFIGDERETANVLVENVTANGGINIYNAHQVTLRDVDVTGTDYYAVWCDENGQAVVESGTFRTNGVALLGLAEGDVNASMLIQGGNFITTDSTPLIFEDGTHPVITGGDFTADPSAYLADGLMTVASEKDGYRFTVAEKQNEVVVSTAPSTVEEYEPEDTATEEEVALADAVYQALTDTTVGGSALPGIDNGSLAAAANTVANEVTLTPEEALDDLNQAIEGEVTAAEVTIVVQPYMDIQIKGVSVADGTKTVTLDITPMYRTVATKADLTDPDSEIVLEASEESGPVNAVVIGTPQEMTITTPVAVTVPLPDDFTESDTLYVRHVKDNGNTYYYTGKVENCVLTFTNSKGFSEFTIASTSEAAAEISGVGYQSLQDAIAEVKDGQTIKLLKNEESASVSRTVSFFVDDNGYDFELTAGSRYEMTVDAETGAYSFTYVGGGSSGATTYVVTVKDAANGTVKTSVSRASSGSTVTITATPDAGYVLDTLTVTNKSGDKLELTKKNDTQYTFTMPASAVTVQATFTGEDGASQLPFTDVSTSDWFYEAVKYVYENDMMNGTNETKFAPDANLTRGMIAQVLYNLEGASSGADAAFDDVAADAWYADAVNWAAANGIVDGYGDGTFGPENNITREQMATILYRYAQYKGYDTTQGGMEIREFSDYDQISEYAMSAMTWAVNTGLLNGKGDGILDPTGTATRAEVAQILMNFCENIAE
jgi:hypothetical protein